jgi:hypothetical protein
MDARDGKMRRVWQQGRTLLPALIAVVTAAGVLGCAAKKPSHDSAGLFVSPKLDFRHGELPNQWRRVAVDGTVLAYDENALGATISVSYDCKDVADVSLRSLVQQELSGIEKMQVIERGDTPLDGREGADWIVRGELDGVPVQMNLVVLRAGNCVYDLLLVSGSDEFPAERAAFTVFVNGFDVVE